MISFIKKNKIFSFLLILSIFLFLLSLFITSIFPESIKSEINDYTNNFLVNKSFEKTYSFFPICFDHLLPISIVWLLGISVIGIILVIAFLFLKIILFSWNFVFLFSHVNSSNFVFIMCYLLPSFFYLIILFFASFYSISYSFLLIRFLFQKNEISFHNITHNYCIVFLFFLIFTIFLSFLEGFLFSLFP